jgi:hypothetical protein
MVKSSVTSKLRPQFVRSVRLRSLSASSVVLDSVGFIKQRNGGGVLRLKLVGPVAELRALRMDVGSRVKLSKGAVSAQEE